MYSFWSSCLGDTRKTAKYNNRENQCQEHLPFALDSEAIWFDGKTSLAALQMHAKMRVKIRQ